LLNTDHSLLNPDSVSYQMLVSLKFLHVIHRTYITTWKQFQWSSWKDHQELLSHYSSQLCCHKQLNYMHWHVVFQENLYVHIIWKVQYIEEDQSMESFKKFITTNEINDEANSSTRKGFWIIFTVRARSWTFGFLCIMRFLSVFTTSFVCLCWGNMKILNTKLWQHIKSTLSNKLPGVQ